MNILYYLNIDKIIKQKYRSIYYPYSSLIKLILFMDIKGIHNQSEMERHLKKHKRERKKLGLNRVPDQATISKFKNHYLNDETKEIISYISNKITKIAKEFNIDLDNKQQKKKKKKHQSSKLFYLDCETRKAIKLLKKLLIESQLIKIRHNRVYDLEDYIDILIKMMLQNTYAETGSKQFRKDKIIEKRFTMCGVCHRSILYPLSNKVKKDWALNYLYCPECGYRERLAPHGETLLKHISTKFHNVEELMKHFEILFEKIWYQTKRYMLFRKPVILSIDYTEIPFYGDFNTVGVEGNKEMKGTFYGYTFYTVYISKFGRRYTLFTLPLIKHRKGVPESKYLYDQNVILRQLLAYAKRKVKIKLVLMDRGFYNSNAIKIIEDMGLKYLTICKKETKKKLKDKIKNISSHSVIPKYKYGTCEFNLLVVRKKVRDLKKSWTLKEVIWRYATNVKPTGDAHDWVEKMVKLYPKRWGVETSYRKIKEDFSPKTTSKKYIIRLFYFLLSVLFYNLWIFVNILVFFSLYNEIKKDPEIHAKEFLQEFYHIDPGG